jgi:hypothetical protein
MDHASVTILVKHFGDQLSPEGLRATVKRLKVWTGEHWDFNGQYGVCRSSLEALSSLVTLAPGAPNPKDLQSKSILASLRQSSRE